MRLTPKMKYAARPQHGSGRPAHAALRGLWAHIIADMLRHAWQTCNGGSSRRLHMEHCFFASPHLHPAPCDIAIRGTLISPREYSREMQHACFECHLQCKNAPAIDSDGACLSPSLVFPKPCSSKSVSCKLQLITRWRQQCLRRRRCVAGNSCAVNSSCQPRLCDYIPSHVDEPVLAYFVPRRMVASCGGVGWDGCVAAGICLVCSVCRGPSGKVRLCCF